MTSTSESFMLPNRVVTHSANRYVREWRRLGRAVIRALGEEGWEAWAFDPDVCLRHEDGRRFDCPRWLALRLAKIVEGGA
jgi:hypothetical protein